MEEKKPEFKLVAIMADGISHVRSVPSDVAEDTVTQQFWTERAAKAAKPADKDSAFELLNIKKH